MPTCDTTLEDAEVSRQDLSIGITFHHLGLILAAAAGLVAVVIASYLIWRHALSYSRPVEQKHIIRILFMIPVYAIVSFLSYLSYKHAVYYQVLRDCYEAFAIASFFTLLCNYIAPSLHDQKDYFRSITVKNWIWPVSWLQKCTGGQDKGPFRKPGNGLTWFNITYLGVFQYCFIRVFFTIVAVSAQAGGRYCENSLNPAFAHIWVTVFEAVSVTFAMYALIQFYYQTKTELAHQRPFLKLLCIKLVIFFCFWQTLVISFLSSSRGPLQPTPKLAYPDIQTGIPSMLICLEMAFFAVLHLWAFPWRRSYGPDSGAKVFYGGSMGIYAFMEAFNPWDILKATARGFRWLFVGVRRRKQDHGYQTSAPKGAGGAQWGGDAFSGPESSHPGNEGYAPHHDSTPTKLQDFGAPKRFNTIPLNDATPPTDERRTAPRTRLQDYDNDDTWDPDMDADDELVYGRGRGRPVRSSYGIPSEDRAELLRYPGQPAHVGISPARSELDALPSTRGNSTSPAPTGPRPVQMPSYPGEFDKETGTEAQYSAYGRGFLRRGESHGA